MRESRMWARVVAVCLTVASGTAFADSGPPGATDPQPGDAHLPSDDRRPSDERLFLIPTPQTMKRGSVSLSDDAALLVRAAAGVSQRVQLDLRLGALPIPGAAGGALPLPGGIVVGGGAGLVVVGLVDVGIKVRVLTETLTRPGIAVSYDLVDVFAGAVGGAGIALAEDSRQANTEIAAVRARPRDCIARWLTRTVKPGYRQHHRRRPSDPLTLCLFRHDSKPGQINPWPRARPHVRGSSVSLLLRARSWRQTGRVSGTKKPEDAVRLYPHGLRADRRSIRKVLEVIATVKARERSRPSKTPHE